jgi:hypothetical protein
VILVPVPTKVPPHDPEYHCEDEFVPVEFKVTDPPLQIEVGPVIAVGAAGATIVALKLEITTYCFGLLYVVFADRY